MKKISFLTLSSLILGCVPTILVSCTNDYNKDHDNFIIKRNASNKAGNFAYAYPLNYNSDLSEINLASAAKLVRLSSQNQPKIDFRDNITTIPTELWYELEHCESITIKNNKDDPGIIFNNNSIKKVIYGSAGSESDILYPTPDKGNGFYSPYLFVDSSKARSINSKNFFNALKNAYSITLKINSGSNLKNYWINNLGSSSIDNKQYPITMRDFRLGLIRSRFKNKNFRDKFIQAHPLYKNLINKELSSYDELNPYFNGEDIDDFFDFYNIDKSVLEPESLNDVNENVLEEITFKSNSNLPIDMTDFYRKILIYSNIMDALPYDYLSLKYGDDLFDHNKGFNWFYEYGKTFDKTLFCSYYYVTFNNQYETKLYRNTNYQTKFTFWQNQRHLNEVIYKYNPLPIANETFGLQMFNAFKQNIVSTVDLNLLTKSQRDEIFSNYANYNISFTKTFSKNSAPSKIILNNFPKGKNLHFNNHFANLYYGLENFDENYDLKNSLNAKTILFKNLINQVINQYGIIDILNNNNEVWVSQAPVDLLINSLNKNENTNYSSLRDAIQNLNSVIDLQNGGKILFPYINKEKTINNKNIFNTKEKLKAANFSNIKENLSNIIEEYFKHKIKSDIVWEIPILSDNLNNDQKEAIKIIEDIFVEIHPLLKAKVKYIDNYDLYYEYFKKDASLYKEQSLDIKQDSALFFIKEMLLNNNCESLSYIIHLVKSLHVTNEKVYKECKSLIKEIQDKDLVLYNILYNKKVNDLITKKDQTKIKNILNNYFNRIQIGTEQIIHLVNEINNIFSLTISFENNIDNSTYSKVIYQKFIVKPLTYNGLSYLQDVLIKGST